MPRSKPPRRKPKPHVPHPVIPMLQRIAAEGLIIPAGLHSYGLMGAPIDARTTEAFMAGCAYLFGFMVNMNDDDGSGDDEEPTEADLGRMDALAKEIERIDILLRTKYGKPMGSA